MVSAAPCDDSWFWHYLGLSRSRTSSSIHLARWLRYIEVLSSPRSQGNPSSYRGLPGTGNATCASRPIGLDVNPSFVHAHSEMLVRAPIRLYTIHTED